jgi:nucleoside-diphosphate-sugar epimerase
MLGDLSHYRRCRVHRLAPDAYACLRGDKVRAFDNFCTGSRRNLARILHRIEFHEGDLRDAAAVERACEGVDYVLHQGALPSVPRSVKDPRTSHEANIDGTFNVLEGARANGAKRVVYAASSSAYGNQPGFPRHEGMTPQPIAPYPVQKLAGELYMQSYWRVYGLETVCLRYFNIFGPRQVPDSPYSGVMAKFILQMMRGETAGDLRRWRAGAGLHVRRQRGEREPAGLGSSAEKVAGRVFNVACGERHTLNETYEVLAQLLEFDGIPIYGPDARGDVRDSLADIGAAREAFGYKPLVGFEEGLRRTVAWYLDTMGDAPGK